MKSRNILGAGQLLLIIGMTLAGCSVLSPQQDRARYFVLMPTADVASPEPVALRGSDRVLIVGLGPINIPQYLDRPEVVTRLGDTEFSASDTDRWGEPLDVSVSRVLKQDLAAAYPGLQIVPFPWSSKERIDYQVSVNFERLERTADGQAVVRAVWTVEAPDGKMLQKGNTKAAAAAGNDQASASAALSRGIVQVSADIGQAVTKQSTLKSNQ